jgi:hypothetical protein
VTAISEKAIGGRFPTREQMAADAEWFDRYQRTSMAVMTGAFATDVAIGPDGTVPFYLDETAWSVPCPPG